MGQAQDIEKDVAKLLSANQSERLEQLLLQQSGIWAFEDDDVCKKLGLTANQRQRLASIQEDVQQTQRRPGLAARTQWPPMERALKLLTPDQQAHWHKITGDPFKGELPGPDLAYSVGGTFVVRMSPMSIVAPKPPQNKPPIDRATPPAGAPGK